MRVRLKPSYLEPSAKGAMTQWLSLLVRQKWWFSDSAPEGGFAGTGAILTHLI